MSTSNGFENLSLLAPLLGAFGIGATGYEFGVGICMGIGGAYAAQYILKNGMVENAKPLPNVGTLLIGVLFSIASGQLADYLWPNFPIVLAMFGGGFMSSFIGPAALKLGAAISRSVPDIVSGVLRSKFSKPHQGDGK